MGPPESMREHIVASSKAMRNGDWTKARDFIVNEKMNGKVWDQKDPGGKHEHCKFNFYLMN